MTHRSRICTLLVDTSAQSYETVARFWSGALGRKLEYLGAGALRAPADRRRRWGPKAQRNGRNCGP
jgi:hypothetical protein